LTRIAWFDLARRTGWAVDGPVPGKPLCGVWELTPPLAARGGGKNYGRGYSELRSKAMKLLVEHGIEAVGFEAAINPMARPTDERGKPKTSPDAMRVLPGYVAQIECLAEDLGLPCFEKPAISIKKHLTGNGYAEKVEMVRMCVLFGWEVGGDHNAADAAGGWSLLKSLIDPGWAPNATRLFAGR
jgi:hypothetical protein